MTWSICVKQKEHGINLCARVLIVLIVPVAPSTSQWVSQSLQLGYYHFACLADDAMVQTHLCVVFRSGPSPGCKSSRGNRWTAFRVSFIYSSYLLLGRFDGLRMNSTLDNFVCLWGPSSVFSCKIMAKRRSKLQMRQLLLTRGKEECSPFYHCVNRSHIIMTYVSTFRFITELSKYFPMFSPRSWFICVLLGLMEINGWHVEISITIGTLLRSFQIRNGTGHEYGIKCNWKTHATWLVAVSSAQHFRY